MTSARSRSHTADVDAADDRMPDHPIKPTNFLKYANSPVLRYILRIIPANAKLSAGSKIQPELLGKIPGTMSANGEWTGFGWSSNVTTKQQLMGWQQQQASSKVVVPLAARTGDMLIAIDFDVENETYLTAARDVAERHLGVTPVVRRRDGSIRCALIYRHKAGTQPIRKFAGAYVDEQGQKQLIETLGTGQQVVLEGPHAKGAMHYWEGDRELVDHLNNIAEITSDQVSAFYLDLHNTATIVFDYTKQKLSLPSGGGNRAAAVSITNLMSPHLATDKELLARRLKPSTSTTRGWRTMILGARCSAQCGRLAAAIASSTTSTSGRGWRTTRRITQRRWSSSWRASKIASWAPNMSTALLQILGLTKAGTP
jgi:hypothetical protein